MSDAVLRPHKRPLLSAVLPPELCFAASAKLMASARRLFARGLLREPGLARALRWSQALSRAGLFAWRERAEHRRPEPGR